MRWFLVVLLLFVVGCGEKNVVAPEVEEREKPYGADNCGLGSPCYDE